MPFDATGRMAAAIPFAFDDYLDLIDATGRVIGEDKKGCIPGETATYPVQLPESSIGQDHYALRA